jgi:hypothetical protein
MCIDPEEDSTSVSELVNVKMGWNSHGVRRIM